MVTVFVADPADDMSAAYDKIVAELTGKGFRVLIEPADDLPSNPDEAAKVLANGAR